MPYPTKESILQKSARWVKGDLIEYPLTKLWGRIVANSQKSVTTSSEWLSCISIWHTSRVQNSWPPFFEAPVSPLWSNCRMLYVYLSKLPYGPCLHPKRELICIQNRRSALSWPAKGQGLIHVPGHRAHNHGACYPTATVQLRQLRRSL